ncbi:glycosyltransferase family 4 protein [Burkholderia multivorans]|uniref:glycosyltransferase family 4 protein n=1 Tax=Burkholderia multivorans TaxID=87883 RepID=UPI000CFF66FA|nr:glycosyltransferase family 1 protein [Burkholderia multivorans]MBU9364709.1 glycosyltransferase family 4 protein [Burkholderia multivorans]MBU9466919.1 glycosyltransferase family 4 protein [Burkholderia multivorans]MCA8127987.1 glycosyltransferase family 4 protein [Burkholderia multivorans]MCA8336435.1 glycosyltransferase family 4 protein [Burkholderia multivorans]MCA8412000.1 glycosyltransferase family 4 protein [Burkholderia multivorans]
MKLGVDITWMVGNYRGMGRFARQLVAPVSASVVGLAPNGVSTEEWPCVSGGRGFFPWWEQVELPRLCREQKLDYLLCPYNTGPLRSIGNTRLIAVVHDLIYMKPWSVLPPARSLYQTAGRIYRRHVVPRLARQADVVLTISRYTQRELVETLGLREADVQVIPCAISDEWFAPPLSRSEREPYLFTVAGEVPSKNVDRLLQAFAMARPALGDDARLRIAGIKADHHAHFLGRANSLGLAGLVELLGYVSRDELREQYRRARAFVFASVFEGFGIPLLEAMASGTPVACSNTTSIPEIVGACGLQFDPYSVEHMAEQIRQVWCDEKRFEVAFDAGMARARTFSESAVRPRVEDFWARLS